MAMGRAFIPHLGLQNDECLFANGIFKPYAVTYVAQIGHSRLPLMLMSYLGTLKSWMYRPIFQFFGTGTGAVREPMVLAGAAGLWLFFQFLRRAAGYRAAILGCGLLAADSLYLLTICFDWGPVAMQHLMLLGGISLLLGFYQERDPRRLFWGWFLLGLGMWDKALMIWMLAGMGVAVLALYVREILGVFSWRRLAISVLGFLLGALPLVVYNVDQKFITFRGNASYETGNIAGKARLLQATADSRALFGWLVNEDWQTPAPHAPKGVVQSASARISALTGRQRHNWMVYAFVLALLLTPFAGAARRAILFALITMAVAWLQMAVTANAGGSVHHAILIWPLPEMVIAISFAAASRRLKRAGLPALAVVLAVMMASGLLVTNEYFYLMIRNGGGQNWTDAIYALSRYLEGTQAGNIFCMDWGMMDSLRLLHRGKLPLRVGTDPISKKSLTDDDRTMLGKQISEPDHLFINHTKDWEFFQGVNDRLVAYASEAGYRREVLATIPDEYGRNVYEVYHFVRGQGPGAGGR